MKPAISFQAFKRKHKDYRMEIQQYFLLLLFPLFFCVILYLSIQRMVAVQTQENADNSIRQVYASLSSMMHEVDMVNNSIFINVALLSNANDAQAALPYTLEDPVSICRELEIHRGNSSFIKDIFLISKEWDGIYSTKGYYGMVSLDSILHGIQLTPDALERITEKTWKMRTRSYLSDPYYINPLHSYTGEINGYVLITLDLNSFVNLISDFRADFVALYNEDTLITSQTLKKDSANIDWNSEQAISQLLEMPVKCFYAEKDGYTYMIALSKSQYYSPLRSISLMFLVYAFWVFILGYLYLRKVSKERFQQLSSLIEVLPQESSAATYKDLLPTVQKALLDLRDKAEKSTDSTLQRILHDIIYGHYSNLQTDIHLDQLGVCSNESPCYAAVFTIRAFDNIAAVSSDSEDVHDMTWTIFQSTVQHFAGEDLKTVSCVGPNCFFTIFHDPQTESYSQQVMAICESTCKFMSDSYGVQLHVALSNAVERHEIASAFRQAQELERFSVAIGSSSRMICQNLLEANAGLMVNGDFIRQEQILINTLILEKYEAVASMVETILQEHVASLSSKYELALSRLKTISNILAEVLINLHPEGIDIKTCTKEFEAADSIEALNTITAKYYAAAAEYIQSRQTTTYKEVETACSYIQEHLSDQNLNVSMICEAVGIIVQRLTPMFREQLDMGIAEYVNYKRIEEAKRLLSSTKLTVKQITEEIGYSTTDTFTRNFRKLENLTPTEYRKMIS